MTNAGHDGVPYKHVGRHEMKVGGCGCSRWIAAGGEKYGEKSDLM